MAKVIRKVNRKVQDNLKSALKDLNGVDLKVGWFETAKYADGTPVAYVASVHEFGSPKNNIPIRSFMRPTIEQNENSWNKFINQQAKDIFKGTQSTEGMLDLLGLNVAGEIAKSIAQVSSPPLQESTIAAKRSKMADKGSTGSLDKPLVETSLMISSVTHTVGE